MADGDAEGLHIGPVVLKAGQHVSGPGRDRGKCLRRHDVWEEEAKSVVLAADVHLFECHRVVRSQLLEAHRPAVERRPRERHRLRAPDIGEPAESSGDDGWRGAGEVVMEVPLLTKVTERVVGAEGALLRQPTTADRDRLVLDDREVIGAPRCLIGSRHPIARLGVLRFEPDSQVDDGDGDGGILQQSQGGTSSSRTRTDDQDRGRCRIRCHLSDSGDGARTGRRRTLGQPRTRR